MSPFKILCFHNTSRRWDRSTISIYVTPMARLSQKPLDFRTFCVSYSSCDVFCDFYRYNFP
jgi:hypothetical protein